MNEHRKGTRRRHGADLKMEVVRACGEPGASVAAVALAYGLNANLVRQWLRGRGFRPEGTTVLPAKAPRSPQFVPLTLPAPVAAKPEAMASPAADIRVKVRRGNVQLDVSWPESAAAECAGWLRELLR